MKYTGSTFHTVSAVTKRAVLLAIGSFAVTVLMRHWAGEAWASAITDGLIAALSDLGLRGAEGVYDIKRQAAGDVRAGDVTQG